MTTFALTGNGQTYTSNTLPIYDSAFRFWRCQDVKGNDFNVSDPSGSTFAVTGTSYPVLTPMQFYLAFTPTERMAIKKSTDPMVAEFWATYQLAAQLNNTIDPNLVSVQEGLSWLATPTTATPAGPGILASTARIAQISAGTPQ